MTTTKQTSWLIIMAAIVVIIAGMKMAESLLVPFMLSVFIALICSPPLAWLKAKGVPAGLAIAMIVVMISLAAMVVGVVVGSSINEFREDIPLYQQKNHPAARGQRHLSGTKGHRVGYGAGSLQF